MVFEVRDLGFRASGKVLGIPRKDRANPACDHSAYDPSEPLIWKTNTKIYQR